LSQLGKASGTAQAIEESRAKFVFQLADLLRQRRLRNVRLPRGTAETAGVHNGAKVAKLMKFHELISRCSLRK
jgi:hypothetical protein